MVGVNISRDDGLPYHENLLYIYIFLNLGPATTSLCAFVLYSGVA